MAKGGGLYEVGRGKPPRKTRFKPGESGNPNGRPKGSKNFATVLAKELNAKVPISENGRRRKVSKREAIAKQIVNKAAGGDLKATQAVMREDRELGAVVSSGPDLSALDSTDRTEVTAELIRRIRSMDWHPPIDPPGAVAGLNNSKSSANRKGRKS